MDAKNVFNRVIEDAPSPLGWLGLGLACIHTKEYPLAEDALT